MVLKPTVGRQAPTVSDCGHIHMADCHRYHIYMADCHRYTYGLPPLYVWRTATVTIQTDCGWLTSLCKPTVDGPCRSSNRRDFSGPREDGPTLSGEDGPTLSGITSLGEADRLSGESLQCQVNTWRVPFRILTDGKACRFQSCLGFWHAPL